MCNSYEQRTSWQAYKDLLRNLTIDVPEWQNELDLPQADIVRIGDTAPAMAASDGLAKLAPMRFGLPSKSPKSALIFDFRSDGRNFAKDQRCVIPASAFFGYTGARYPKARHRFILAGEPFMGIAGIWRRGEGNQLSAFAMLTTEPDSDVAPYHNRQIVVLRPEDWWPWLAMTRPESELLKALPAGSLKVEIERREVGEPAQPKR